MKFPHTLIHYLIGFVAIIIGVCALTQSHHAHKVTLVEQNGVMTQEKAGRFDWPSLDQQQTILIGESLQKSTISKVKIFCASSACHKISLDLDDSLQIAGISSDFEGDHVDSESDYGVFVGPPGDDANKVAAAITGATHIIPTIVPIDGIEGVGIIIGKYKGAGQ